MNVQSTCSLSIGHVKLLIFNPYNLLIKTAINLTAHPPKKTIKKHTCNKLKIFNWKSKELGIFCFGN